MILGIENLLSLRQLDIQNNRLRSIGTRLLSLSNMAELYLACNAIESVCGLPQSAGLNTVDLSNNPIFSLEGIQQVNTYVTGILFFVFSFDQINFQYSPPLSAKLHFSRIVNLHFSQSFTISLYIFFFITFFLFSVHQY